MSERPAELPLDPEYSLGLTVCRIALDQSTGRILRPNTAGILVRGALFAELALAGRLTGSRWPLAIGESDLSGELADSLHRALAANPPIYFKRWFSHTAVDVDAALKALERHGMISENGPGHWRDNDPALLAAQTERIVQLFALADKAPTPAALHAITGVVPPEDAVVALMATGAGIGGGRPRPRRALRLLDKLLPAETVESPNQLTTTRSAVRYSLQVARRRAGTRIRSS